MVTLAEAAEIAAWEGRQRPRAGADPGTVRKAAALVEKLDRVLDEFGARLCDGAQPIRFELIGRNDEDVDRPRFEAIPVDTADRCEPTGFTIGFVR